MFPPMPQPSPMAAAPSYASLAGAPQGAPADGGATLGGNQMGNTLIKMGMEVDQALKMLAKIAPGMAEWVLRTTQELQQQIGASLQGQLTQLTDNAPFPDGSSRMSGLAG